MAHGPGSAGRARLRRLGQPSWRDEGQDPDYRFSLANERTFLAWIRTALSLLAAAVAVVQLVPAFRLHGTREVLGAVLAAIGCLCAGLAYPRWAANERAMRTSASLPRGAALILLSIALMIVGVAVVVLAATSKR